MTHAAYLAYAKTDRLSAGGRRCEAQAFAEAARRLQAAASGSRRDRVAAAQFNQRLWTVLQADVTDPRNTLPDDLKAKILSLSLFMDKGLGLLRRSNDTGRLAAMVAINRAMASAQFSDAHAG